MKDRQNIMLKKVNPYHLFKTFNLLNSDEKKSK